MGDVHFTGGDAGHDLGAGSAGQQGDVEALFAEKTTSEGLVETAVFGLGDPVELDGDFCWGGRRDGGVESEELSAESEEQNTAEGGQRAA